MPPSAEDRDALFKRFGRAFFKKDLDAMYEVVTEDFVSDAHAANLAVQVWTINTCEEMLRMMDLGVDAIMTDRPILLEELLNTPADQRSCE